MQVNTNTFIKVKKYPNLPGPTCKMNLIYLNYENEIMSCD